MLDLSHELNRRIGLFIDRRGRVAAGDPRRGPLAWRSPSSTACAGSPAASAAIRLVTTHLVHRSDRPRGTRGPRQAAAGPAWRPMHLEAQPGSRHRSGRPGAPHGSGRARRRSRRIDQWPRVLAGGTRLVNLDSPWTRARSRPSRFPFDAVHPRARSGARRFATAAARAEETKGVRAMALMVHSGGPHGRCSKGRAAQSCAARRESPSSTWSEQRRPHPDPRTFMGSGKLREVLVRALEQDVEVLICDPELSASQVADDRGPDRPSSVIDRTMLILDIFAKHASSSRREAAGGAGAASLQPAED